MKRNDVLAITIADVAREAGVSAMTVSRALREPGKVSAKSLEKIRAVIDRLGYVPDPAARALAAGRTNVIGVIVPSVTNNVFADVMAGIYSRAEGTDWQVQLGNSRYSPLEEERLVRTFLSQRPAVADHFRHRPVGRHCSGAAFRQLPHRPGDGDRSRAVRP